MTRPKVLSDLSPGMQRGLIRCHTLVVEFADERHCGIAPRTLDALLRRGLIEAATDARLRRVYRPTPDGWGLLRADEPLWLHKRSQRGYPRLAHHAVLDAGEVVPPTVLEEYAKDAAERRRGEPGRRVAELDSRIRNLALRARQAAKAGDDEVLRALGSELDGLERQVVELERAREKRAA